MESEPASREIIGNVEGGGPVNAALSENVQAHYISRHSPDLDVGALAL